MTANEAAIRKAYRVAENRDVAGFVNCFTEDGTAAVACARDREARRA